MSSNDKLLKVTIQDTENILFKGDVDRISSFNEVGPFDIFPMHANFISLIQKNLVLYHKQQKVKELKIQQAVMKVKQDIVEIFLGMEVLQIDEDTIVNQQIPHTSTEEKNNKNK